MKEIWPVLFILVVIAFVAYTHLIPNDGSDGGH